MTWDDIIQAIGMFCVLKLSQFEFLIQSIPTDVTHIDKSSSVSSGGSCRVL